MSTSAVEAIDPAIKPANVVENVNDKTPDPETPPVVDKAPDPPRPDEGGLDALNARVTSLADAVTALTDVVTGVVAQRDSAPRKLPWTHRGRKVANP